MKERVYVQEVRDYGAGKSVFAPTGGAGILSSSFYGEAVICVEKHWTDRFILRAWSTATPQ